MNQKNPTQRKRIALILGGGAPNATLMAGTLEAFIENGVSFDVISTAGAGALVGLLYAAPKGGDAIQALRGLVDSGVEDSLYQYFPVNFKVFNKPGNLADAWRRLWSSNPLLRQLEQTPGAPARLMADWLRLSIATLSPSDLTPASTGLCAHVPFIDELVDFSALPALDAEFYLNAYNLSRHAMRSWNKQHITKDAFLAALSFPLIYPPYLLEGDYYIEGAAIDTLNFKGVLESEQSIDTIVVFDVLGCERILHPPRDLYDAWVQSIITPLVELARDDLKLFEYHYNLDPVTRQPLRELLRVRYEDYLDPQTAHTELDWSRSNLARLYEVGKRAGTAFCQEHAAALGR